MTDASAPTSRRPGAPRGNRNRLTHGLYARAAVERRAATRRIVAACRAVCAGVPGIAADWEALNRSGWSKRKKAKIDVQIALTLFKFLAKCLKSADLPPDYPIEPPPPRPPRRFRGKVQSASGAAGNPPVPAVDSL